MANRTKITMAGAHLCACGRTRGRAVGQRGVQLLVLTELPPQPAAVAEHHGKQPHLPKLLGCPAAADHAAGKIDLCLFARRGLESNLKPARCGRPDLKQMIAQDRNAAAIALRPDLAQKTGGAQLWMPGHPSEQISAVGVELGRPRPARHLGGVARFAA